MDGSFSTPSYNSIGDPYVDCKENTVHVIRGQRQFLSASSKKGQTGADWGSGTRKFVGLTGQYQEQYKEECTYRKENTSKNILPTGFRFSNPSKKRYIYLINLYNFTNIINVRVVVVWVITMERFHRQELNTCRMASTKVVEWPSNIQKVSREISSLLPANGALMDIQEPSWEGKKFLILKREKK